MTKKNIIPLEPSDMDVLFNQLHACVFVLNHRARVIYMNPAAERFLSISFEVARKTKLSKVIRAGRRLLSPIREVLKSGRSIRIHEVEIMLEQGPVKAQVELAPIGNHEKVSGVLLWVNELSTVEDLEEERRVLDRLSMMGTLASGLAHEIRNPLGGIRGAAQLLSREAPTSEHKEYASIIVSEADRLNKLMTELLDFSNPKPIKMSPVNINKLLSEVLSLQEETFKSQRTELKQEFDPSLPFVLGHEDSLKQAFLNLINNALEAMGQGGSLHVITSFLPNVRLLLGEGRAGPMAQVTIRDTGPGIPEENLKSLFTPFFTTKPKGTGLGLMITQRILKEHQGGLKVHSELEKGTSFRVFLKLATLQPKD
jgi:two-component system nitrogen regulation sensor histidine kinase GlnL